MLIETSQKRYGEGEEKGLIVEIGTSVSDLYITNKPRWYFRIADCSLQIAVGLLILEITFN